MGCGQWCCLGCASLEASFRSWAAVALFVSQHNKGESINSWLFPSPCWLGLQAALWLYLQPLEDNELILINYP